MSTWVVKLLVAANAFSKIRRLTQTPLQQLRFAGQRLADEVPNKATNDDVLA